MPLPQPPRRLVCALLLALAAACAPTAAAQPGLLLGVTDDGLKWTQHPAPLRDALHDLGLGAVRFTQTWRPGDTRLSSADVSNLDHAVANARGLRIVLSVYGAAGAAPQDDSSRAQYCSYVRAIVARYPQIRDVVVWNEVNSSMFWKPQYAADGSSAAPAAYERLLAACYGPLHAARPGLNVIASLAPRGNDDPRAPGTVTHAAATFVRGLGAAYRASGREVKIFDTFGQNAYPRRSSERPWRFHDGAVDVSEGDYGRLLAALSDAFSGTGQPLPGEGDVTVWYLEDGFQTTVDPAKAGAYHGRENDPSALPPVAARPDAASPADDSPAPDQATQLVDAVQLAYCQPGVGAFLNFMLEDENDLAGWQSGVLWADGTHKLSFDALQRVAQEVRDGSIDCATVRGADTGAPEDAAPTEPCATARGPLVVTAPAVVRPPAATDLDAVVRDAAAAAGCSTPPVAVDARAPASATAVAATVDALATRGARPFLVVARGKAAAASPRAAGIVVAAAPTPAAVRAASAELARAGVPPARRGILVETRASLPALRQLGTTLGLGSVWMGGGSR